MGSVFSPLTDPRQEDMGLWHHPLICRCTESLRDIYSSVWQGDTQGLISEDDVSFWAGHFASSSFGDRVFGSCLAIFLQPKAPVKLQVRHKEITRSLISEASETFFKKIGHSFFYPWSSNLQQMLSPALRASGHQGDQAFQESYVT